MAGQDWLGGKARLRQDRTRQNTPTQERARHDVQRQRGGARQERVRQARHSARLNKTEPNKTGVRRTLHARRQEREDGQTSLK